MTEKFIRAVPLFASMPEEEIRGLAELCEQKTVPAGTLLFQEGEPGGRFYILLEGEVEIIKALGSSDERLLAIRSPGSFIGEMSFFSHDGLHTASVRAHTSLNVLEMNYEDLQALLERHPYLAYEMVRTLSSRLEESENLTIRELREKNRQLTKAYNDLKEAQAQIIEQERLKRELEVARQIQSDILPRRSPKRQGFSFGQKMVPMSAIGGDFYDLIPLGEDSVGIAVGDVSDHGVPAALFMAMTVTLIRAEAYRGISPTEVLRRIDLLLRPMNDSDMFVTILYGILDFNTREFTYARAGHPLPILLGREGDFTPIERKPGQPLGLFPDFDIDEGRLTISPGDMLCIYTDGVTETMDHSGDMFGEARLEKFLTANNSLAAQDLCDRVFSMLGDFRAGEPQLDDVTVLVLKTE